MKRKNSLITILLYFFVYCAFGQDKQFDSLNLVLRTTKQDTVKLFTLVQITEICELNDIPYYAEKAVKLSDKILAQTNYDRKRILIQKAKALNNWGVMYDYQENIPKAIEYYMACLKINEITKDIESSAATLNNIGGAYKKNGNTTMALLFHLKSLRMWEQTSNKKNTATSLHNIGIILGFQGNLKKALNYYHKSLKLREQLGDKKDLASSYNAIGYLFGTQGNFRKSLYYFIKSLKYSREINDEKEIATTLNNIGSLYQNYHNNSTAIVYFERSMKIREKIGDKNGLASSLNNIGYVHLSNGNTEAALQNFKKSLAISKTYENIEGIAVSQNSIGRSYFERSAQLSGNEKKKELDLAYLYLDSSLSLSKKIGYPERIRNAERIISKVDSARGNYLGAYEHYKQYTIYRDSASNERTRKESIETQLNFEFEKKEAVLKEQQVKERALAKEKNRLQQIIIKFVATAFLIVLVLTIIVFKNLKNTNKQKKIVEEQKRLVDEKQKEILDSIHYAKRIQTSLLPSEKYLDRHLKNKT